MASYKKPSFLDDIPRDRHALIEASAGTGKTHTIEHLFVDLLLTAAASIEEILVMTFTNKATAELRGRLRALLESIVSRVPAIDSDEDAAPLGEDDRQKLDAALFSFDRAPIYTIHGFCQCVLTDLAFYAGGAFQLEVVDGRQAFHNAFRAELRERLTIEESRSDLLRKWLDRQDHTEREGLLASLEELLYQSHVQRYLDTPAVQENARDLMDLALRFDLTMLKEAYGPLNAKVRNRAREAADQLAEVLRKCGGSTNSIRRALVEFQFDPLPIAKVVQQAQKQEGLPPPIAQLLDLIDRVRIASSLDVQIVDSFLPLITERLAREKRYNSQLDFNDMLSWVWQAIDGPGGETLVSILRGRFRFALLDEFQDTDDLQWKIFRRIFLNGARTDSESAGGPRNMLYVVGDPKQAIYGFRGADVFTYLDAVKEIRARGASEIVLRENFRSTKHLLLALNRIFDQDVAAPFFSGEIKYSHPLQCGRPDFRAIDAQGNPIKPITLMRLAGSQGSAPRVRALIGRFIASEIRCILFDDRASIAVEEKDAAQRRIKPDDIFILTRSGAESVEIGEYLREANVPFAFYKQAGLFQSPEAYDVLDVLKAIEEPDSHSRRLRAWASPFFAMPYAQLFTFSEAPVGHPFGERLYAWKALADREEFAQLFDRLLHESGLAARELFLSNSERELTNYVHIFEVILEEALRAQLSLSELIARLELFVAETARPPGADSNIQHLEGERGAVQVMTVHLSKGLQAQVVFLFGGLLKPPDRASIAVYHHGNSRRVAVGKSAKSFFKSHLDQETSEDYQRLAYVAVTRARAKLYLPLYPTGSTIKRSDGYYAPLNERLKSLLAEPNSEAEVAELFDIRDVCIGESPSQALSRLPEILGLWIPPETLLGEDRDGQSAAFFDTLRERHRPLVMRSYTSLVAHTPRSLEMSGREEVTLEEFKYDLDTSAELADLPGGRRVGIFLHEVIERLELDSFADCPDLETWKARDDVRKLFIDTTRRHRVSDQRWLDRGTEIIFNTFTSRLAISLGEFLDPLYTCNNIREMEFIYPIPENTHSLWTSAVGEDTNRQWKAECGYLRGFIDFVFEHRGRYYFADWKSDQLSSYEQEAIEAHVREHYELQARIYCVGVVRLLGIQTPAEYQRRFGGLLYLFLRGIKGNNSGSTGVYFRRPSWDELLGYERFLMGVVAPTRSA